jgi:hypothetical protein
MLRRTTDRPKVARIGQIGLLEGENSVSPTNRSLRRSVHVRRAIRSQDRCLLINTSPTSRDNSD